MGTEKSRLFVAVEIPARVRDDVDAAVGPLRCVAPQVRWVAPDAYHVTMAFVGWVDDDGERAVQDACGEAARAVEPFTLSLTGRAGTFGDGVLWAGLADIPALAQLAGALRDALHARWVGVEQRPFHAHLTLARASRAARIRASVAARYEGPSASWQVERLVMLRSTLRRSGARYLLEGAWLLGGRGR